MTSYVGRSVRNNSQLQSLMFVTLASDQSRGIADEAACIKPMAVYHLL